MKPKLTAVGETPKLKIDKKQIDFVAKIGEKMISEIQRQIDYMRNDSDFYLKANGHDNIVMLSRYWEFAQNEIGHQRATIATAIDPNLSSSEKAKNFRDKMRSRGCAKHVLFLDDEEVTGMAMSREDKEKLGDLLKTLFKHAKKETE